MRYHYLRGTGRRARNRRLLRAGLASLLLAAVCATTLAVRADPAPNQKTASKSSSQEVKALATTAHVRISDCGTGAPKHTNLAQSSVPQLKKLSEYETVCGGAISNTASFFAMLPTTANEANALSKQVAATLKEFAKYKMSPVVFLEPKMSNGQNASVAAYAAGDYDAALDIYFAALKAAGLTDPQMGMWVPLPEGNTPTWGNTDPVVFGQAVTRTVQIQKKYFPTSRASVLLGSKTYPSGENWSGGTYASLTPYIKGIPRGLLESFGLQGFPWGPSDTGRTTEIDPDAYLPASLAIEAAKSVGLPRVWFNTGTFSTFSKESSQLTTATPQQRQAALDKVIAAAKSVQQAGLVTAVHLFAKDKSQTPEKTNWSYWEPGKMSQSKFTPVLKTFVHDARKAQVPLWIYDYQ